MLSSVPLTESADLQAEVRHVLSPGVISVSEHATLHSAQQALVHHGVHAVLVVADGGQPLGWATARGFLRNANRDWSTATARQAISEPVVHVAPDASAADALRLMLAHDVSRLLVGSADGVVADIDLIRLAAGTER